MEAELIQWLKQRASKHERLSIGLGDDAAAITWPTPGRESVVTTDLLTEGVDFLMGEVDPRRIGRKALAVNLSDIAAMGAEPLAAFVSLALPSRGALELAQQLYEGMFPLAEQFNVSIAGGDTNTWDGRLVISVTLIGEVDARQVWRRDRAMAGDWILVTGDFGGSRLAKQFDFTPRLAVAKRLRPSGQVRAAIDVSDGLSLDLSRLAAASGCGARIDLDAIPISADARRMSQLDPDGPDPLTRALSDGEDFELILAVPPDEAARLLETQPLDAPLTHIGELIARPGLFTTDGRELTPRGFLHG
ncbi:MAG: thiamine-monophosphate kinase [Planctomycetales bacterium]|nr:thiamine-monophosphate kinase [Planctomycetales bacterium]